MLLAGGSHMLNAQVFPKDTVLLYSSYKIDLCDYESEDNPYQGRVQLVLDLWSVSVLDSLFGYDFELKYDNETIALNTPLFLNTLTEYMEERAISFMQDTGLAIGYGLSMSIYNPVVGSRPLVAMRGDYIGECPDTTEVKLNYIEFTDEFTRNINGYRNAKVISYIDYSEDRYFNFVPSKNWSDGDRIDIDSVGYDVFALDVNTIPEHNVNDFEVTIKKPTGNFYIDTIWVVSEKVVINSREETDDTIVMNFTAFDNLLDEELFMVYVRNYENQDAEEKIMVDVEILDNCSCVSNVQGIEIPLKSNFVDENTSVTDAKYGIIHNYNQSTEILTVESENNVFTEVNVYNIQGQLLETMDVNSSFLSLTTGKMTNGLYVYQLITANNKVKNIFIIK
jgi:hypothetical protein